jgi:hypothetical protein
MLKLWLLSFDPDLALYSNLRDYFLAATESFGVLGAFYDDKLKAIALYSKLGGKSFVHQFYGPDSRLSELLQVLGKPCELFMRKDQVLIDQTGWKAELEVTPGYVIDHEAYDGVFSRVAPRFAGTVYVTT